MQDRNSRVIELETPFLKNVDSSWIQHVPYQRLSIHFFPPTFPTYLIWFISNLGIHGLHVKDLTDNENNCLLFHFVAVSTKSLGVDQERQITYLDFNRPLIFRAEKIWFQVPLFICNFNTFFQFFIDILKQQEILCVGGHLFSFKKYIYLWWS